MNGISSISTSRRSFPTLGASEIPTDVFIEPTIADVNANEHQHHTLSFLNSRSGEAIPTGYCSNGKFVRDAIKRTSQIKRDYHTGEIKYSDLNLSDIPLHVPISIIISGYSSPRTSAALREITKGMPQKSLHLEGHAANTRIPGCKTSAIRHLLVQLKSGGVDFDAKYDFIQSDTGR